MKVCDFFLPIVRPSLKKATVDKNFLERGWNPCPYTRQFLMCDELIFPLFNEKWGLCHAFDVERSSLLKLINF